MNSRVMFAIFLIAIGSIFLFGQIIGFDPLEVIGIWWPMIIMLFGVHKIANDKDGLFSGAIYIIVALLLQANYLDMLPWGFWSTFWPVSFIFAGIYLIFGRKKFREQRHKKCAKTKHNKYIEEFVIFSGVRKKIAQSNFEGGSLKVIFGSIEFDLSEAEFQNCTLELDIEAMFSSVKIYVPRDWKVNIKGFPVFGGVNIRIDKDIIYSDESPVLNINHLTVLSGIEIIN